MNDTFNLHRFSLLFKKTILERPMQLLGLIALMLTITLAIFSISVYFGSWNGGHAQAFIWGYVGGGIILASVIFSYFNTNASGSAYLVLPASAFEKWLCGVLIAGVLFTCLFLAFYRLMDICFVTFYHSSLDKNTPHYQELYEMSQVYDFGGRIPKSGYTMFLNFAGAMLLGSLYFNRANLVKTALLVAGFLAGMLFLNYGIAKMLIPHLSSASPFSDAGLKFGNDYRMLWMPESGKKAIDILLQYLIPAILWITAYIRLREKEI
jgi:hypothetical protein